VNTVRDLRCTAADAEGVVPLPPTAHYECSVFYNTSDGPPKCPECAAPPADLVPNPSTPLAPDAPAEPNAPGSMPPGGPQP
jgi:hypothetical protein